MLKHLMQKIILNSLLLIFSVFNHVVSSFGSFHELCIYVSRTIIGTFFCCLKIFQHE